MKKVFRGSREEIIKDVKEWLERELDETWNEILLELELIN